MNPLKNTEYDPLPQYEPQTAQSTEIPFSSTLSLDNEYLSTTGTFDKITVEAPGNVSRETILSSGTYSQLYRLFREENHHRISSAIRALCQRCEIRYQQSASQLKKEYSAIQKHPRGWSQDKKNTHKSNVWSVLRVILNTLLLICRGILLILLFPFRLLEKLAHPIDNTIKGSRTLVSLLTTVLLYTAAAGIVTYTVYAVKEENAKGYLLKVYLDDECIGCTENVSDFMNAKHTYEKTLSDAYCMPVVLPCSVHYEPFNGQPDETAPLLNANTTNSVLRAYMQQYLTDGYGLYIDNKLVAVSDSGTLINETLADYQMMMQQNYMRTYGQDVPENFTLNNNVTVIAQKYPKNFMLSVDELRSLFYLDAQQAETDPQTGKTFDYTVTGKSDSGDGADFLSSLPSSNVEVSFSMYVEETEEEEIPFTEEYIYDDTMYQGLRRTMRPGKNGSKITHYKVQYSEDRILSKEQLTEEILEEPVSCIIRSGTKEIPENLKGVLPTGRFIYPYYGTITSPFGWRNIFGSTSFHCGIDIAGPANSTIVAADGGEVVEVSCEGTYGNYVLIRHDEYTVTRYAHCNSVLVDVGDLVGQGYPIALMGHTGRATGDHVHFEVIINGSVVDPMLYLG